MASAIDIVTFFLSQWLFIFPGKKFYKCPVGKENGGCDFFLWAPEADAQPQAHFDTPPASDSRGNQSNTTSWGNQNPSNNVRGWGITPSSSRDSFPSNEDDVMCNCGLPCKRYGGYLTYNVNNKCDKDLVEGSYDLFLFPHRFCFYSWMKNDVID